MTGEWLLLASAAGTAAGFTLDRVVGPGRKIRRRMHGFLGDWEGEPERRTLDGQRILEQRRPGIPERMSSVENDVGEIRTLLNGGGIGGLVVELGEKFSEHIAQADETREEILADVRETRIFVADAARILTANQQRIEDNVRKLDHKVEDRLFVLEEAERAHRAALHEMGMPVDVDTSEGE
jgi:hypothetical protein